MRLSSSTIAPALVAETGASPLALRHALRTVESIIVKADVARALRGPSMTETAREEMLSRVAATGASAAGIPDAAPALTRTLTLLVDGNALDELGPLSSELARIAAARGAHLCVATSAAPLPAHALTALSDGLAAWVGGTVDVEVEVDPAVLGGLRLDLDGRTLDHTFLARLATLQAPRAL